MIAIPDVDCDAVAEAESRGVPPTRNAVVSGYQVPPDEAVISQTRELLDTWRW